ncbi:sodium:proton antiporter, partial [Rhodobacteraceae bacterium R_SAG7]|uniref:cation:proton antiporter n=1 Tax=Rhodobacterales TaxID=204455 RepID=UPI0000462D70|nr:sodium:proton antiporter [Ruegeria sp. TM1040]ABF62766.1 sodium/hydrogen exchanger [Ruegeria sp. TM1040]NKW77911.1 sodium:proton antiporter [Rhodobacteraceae bacterium R_SAG7]
MTFLILLVLLAFALYSLFSKRIDRSVLTLPILFTGLGFLLSKPLSEVIPAGLIHEGKAGLAEVTLILVLFSDASHVRLRSLARGWQYPTRMLVIGLPLTIASGTAVAFWLNPSSGLAVALLTAAVLTPTDAALGQAVVNSPDVPDRLAQTINVESGLNDGLVLPFVLTGAILASGFAGEAHTAGLALEALIEVILGPLAGIAVGWVAARAMDWAQNRDLMQEAAGAVVFLVTAFAAYLFAVLIHGNGFIAAFVAGMVFGNSYRHNIHFISEFMEGAGQLLTMAAFLVFGAFLLPDGLAHAGVSTLVLALLFLTVVRMGPILLSLIGSGLPTREKLFLGWFGPRGLASILFTLLMMDQFDIPNEEELLACVSLTVGLSILLHGITSTPLASWISQEGKRNT